MEIYKDLSNPKSKEFEQLLNNQLSKITIEEGKIIDGKINKISNLKCPCLLAHLSPPSPTHSTYKPHRYSKAHNTL